MSCVLVWSRATRRRTAWIIPEAYFLSLRLFESAGQPRAAVPTQFEEKPAVRGRVARGHTNAPILPVLASGGRTFYFNSRPLFQQRQSRGVVQILVPIFGGHFVDFFHGFERGQFDADFFGGFERQADVFVHET